MFRHIRQCQSRVQPFPYKSSNITVYAILVFVANLNQRPDSDHVIYNLGTERSQYPRVLSGPIETDMECLSVILWEMDHCEQQPMTECLCLNRQINILIILGNIENSDNLFPVDIRVHVFLILYHCHNTKWGH